jgi:hypothetical protein
MKHTDNPSYPDFELTEINRVHLEDPAIVELFESLQETPDRLYEMYRADIYSDRPFASQPEFTVEIIQFPEEGRCAVEWVDGLEWIDSASIEEAVEEWIDHHMDT